MGVIDMVNGRLCETLPVEEIEQIRNESYNQALEDFANEIRPIISEYQQAIKKNKFAFIDIDCIKQKLAR